MIKNNFKNIYVMTTMNCNIHCEHCFVPKIENELSDKDLQRIVDFINHHTEKDFINIIFHGGEPTMVGTKRFREILEFLRDNIKEGIKYRFEIQTNLVILNQELIKIFKEFFEIIGVSYDINIRHVKGGDFEKIFFKNLNTLKEHNIDIFGIITLTQEVLKMKPVKFYTFMKTHFKNIHIEKLTHDGEAINNWKKIGVTNKEYSDYMVELFKIYSKENINSDFFNISPFDAMCKAILAETHYSCKGMCANFYSFGPDSFTGTCTALTTGFKKDLSPEEIVGANMKFTQEVLSRTTNVCEGCEFISLCKEGCPSGKNEVLDESGECRGAKTLLGFVKNELNNSKTLREHFKNKKMSMEQFQ